MASHSVSGSSLPTWGLILIVIGSVVLVLGLTTLIVPFARRLRQRRESSRSSNTPMKFSSAAGMGVRVRVDEESVSTSDHTISAGGGRHKRAQTQDTIATKPLLAAEREISRSSEDGEHHAGPASEHIGRGNEYGLREVSERVEDVDVDSDEGRQPRLKGLEISYPTKLRKVKSQNPNSPTSATGSGKLPFSSLPIARSASEGVGNQKGKMRLGIKDWLSMKLLHTSSFQGPSSSTTISRIFDPSTSNPASTPLKNPNNNVLEGISNPHMRKSSIPPPSNASNSAIEVDIWADTPVHTPTVSAVPSATPSPTNSPSLAPSSLRSSIDVPALTNAFHGDTQAKSRPSTIASGSINRYPSLSPSVASGGTGMSKVSVKSGDTIFSYASNLRSPTNSIIPGTEFASTSTSPFVNAFATSPSSPPSQYRNTIASSSVKAIVQKVPAMPVIPESFRTRPTSALQHSLGEDTFGRDRAGVQSIHGLKDIQWQPFQPPDEGLEVSTAFPASTTPSASTVQNRLQMSRGSEDKNYTRGAKKAHVRDTSDHRQVEHRVVSPKPSVTGSIGFLNSVTGELSKDGKTLKTDSVGTRTPPSEYYSLPSVDGDGSDRPLSTFSDTSTIAGGVERVVPNVGLSDREARDVLHRKALRSARKQRANDSDSSHQQQKLPMTSLTYEPFLPPPYSETSPPSAFLQSRPVGAGVPVGANTTTSQLRLQRPERSSSRFPSTYSTLSNATSFYSTVTTTSAPQLPTPPSSPFQLDLLNTNASQIGSMAGGVRNERDRDSQSTVTVTPTQASRSTVTSMPPVYGRGSVSSR